MNIEFERNGELNGSLTLSLMPADYNTEYEKALKAEAKKANIPGFRKGMVPTGHIKRMYGKQLLADAVNGVINESVNEYIQKENYKILMQPLPVEDNGDYKWDGTDEFTFKFIVGMQPEFEINYDVAPVVNNKVVIDDETLATREMNLRRSYGKMTNPEMVEDKDVVSGVFTFKAAEGDNGGEVVSKGRLRLDDITDNKVKEQLRGLKIGDTVTLDLTNAYADKEELKKSLGLEAGDTNAALNNAELKIEKIFRLEAAELTQEFYDKVFGEGEVTNEEQFHEAVRKELSAVFARDEENLLNNNIHAAILEANKFELPDSFLQEWLAQANKTVKPEQQENNYDEYAKNVRWSLIMDKVITENKIDGTSQELFELAKMRIAEQIRMYSAEQFTEDDLNNYAAELLKNRDNAQQLIDQLRVAKVMDFIKGKVPTEVKEMTYPEFVKIARG